MPVWNVQPVFATRGIVSSAVTEGLVLAAYPLPGGVFYDAISGALAAEVSGGAFGPTVANYYFNNGGTARPSGQARGTETATTIFSGQAFPVQATGADFLTTQGTLLALGSVAASATATQYHWIFGSHEYTAIGTGPMVGKRQFDHEQCADQRPERQAALLRRWMGRHERALVFARQRA
jgi:hypothetical protein